jgi:surface polysaccharide O-acyltransferase-like enzyme
MTLAVFVFEIFLLVLVWAAMALMCLWVWQKTKAQGNLFMTIGAAAIALSRLITMLSDMPGSFVWYWMPFIGTCLLVAGYYLTVKPMIAGQLEALKSKVTGGGGDDD